MAQVSPPKYRLQIDKDLDIQTRDGMRLKADVFRPRGSGRFPAIINLGSYQKDKHWVPPLDLEEKDNPYMNWETVNPLWWVPRGYAAVRVDGRGSGKSPGQTDPFSLQEALDFYDAIEWAARQPWCNGNVGLLGISYFAMTQWFVANLKPPSLKAIIPWEGAADMYRDFAFHGGLFCFGFVANWYMNHMAHHTLGKLYESNPDTFSKNWVWHFMRDNLDRGQYRGRQAEWDKLELPVYTVGNWSGMGLHLRGNTEAFVQAKSKHKKLRIHAGTHYHPFYAEEARHDQIRFFDHWLKGKQNGVMDEPPVKLLIRTGGGKGYKFRYENEWPIKRTKWTKFFLRRVKPAPRARRARRRRPVDPRTGKTRRDRLSGQRHEQGRRRLGVVDLDRARRQPAAHGRVVRNRPAAGAAGNHRPGQPRAVGVEHLGRHGHLRHHPQHRSGRQGRVGSRPATATGAGGQGLAARVAPQARPEKIAALPPVARARRTLAAHDRPDRAQSKSKSGRPAWCSARAIASGSTSSRVTASARRHIRTTAPTTIPASTPSTQAARPRLTCCCR